MASPFLVQKFGGSNTLGGTFANGTNNPSIYTCHFPDNAQGGNCLVLMMTYDQSTTPTITVADNIGTNTWQLGKQEIDTGAGQGFSIYYALSVASGTRDITVSFNVATETFIAVHGMEFSNVAASSATDGNNGNFGAGLTATAGSVTPTQTGDLVIQGMFTSHAVAASTFVAGTGQANISWNLATSDLQDGMAMQWGVYNSTSALNPQMTYTTGGTAGFVTACLFLKASASAQGSDVPSGIRIRGIQHISLLSSKGGASSPVTVAFPCVGNALVLAIMAGQPIASSPPPANVTAITDTNGNNWTSNSEYDGGSNNDCQFWYVQNASTSPNMTMTVSLSAVAKDYTLLCYDITGAAVSGTFYDASSLGTATGNQTTNSSTLVGSSSTPSATNALVIGMLGTDTNTAITITAGLTDNMWYNNDNFDVVSANTDANNGWGHAYVSNPVATQFTYNYLFATDPQKTWSSMSAAFLPSAAVIPIAVTGEQDHWLGGDYY